MTDNDKLDEILNDLLSGIKPDFSTDEVLKAEAKQAILDWHSHSLAQAVAVAKQQMKANVFTQFKIAMTAQEISGTPPEGARFRTPLEELALILEYEAPMSELAELTKKKGES